MCVYLPWLTGSRLGPLGKDFLGAILIEKLFSAPPSQAGNISRSIQETQLMILFGVSLF